ncbi:twin-arginine translocase subunit TatC [Eubacteriales bacterium OttesenSCG-928-A19]|nr:twin-arginine translocase subunit TatC [Eubacteriales bacterium OttesenSCG-928-A19]
MEKQLPLHGHLSELRRRVLSVVIPLICLLPLAFWLAPTFIERLFDPLSALGFSLHLYHVTDGLVLRLRMALMLCLCATAPLLLTQGALFLWPGLYPRERGRLMALLTVGGVLMGGGMLAFALWLTPWLIGLWTAHAGYAPMLSVMACFTLWQGCMLVFGVLCCAPILIFAALRLRGWIKKEDVLT